MDEKEGFGPAHFFQSFGDAVQLVGEVAFSFAYAVFGERGGTRAVEKHFAPFDIGGGGLRN